MSNVTQLDLLCPTEHHSALRKMDALVDVLTYADRYTWAFADAADSPKTQQHAERLLYEARRYVLTMWGEIVPPRRHRHESAGGFLARQMRDPRARRSPRPPRALGERQLAMFPGY